MPIEKELRTAAAAVFLFLQARDDLRSRSVPIRRTLLCAAGALAADGICMVLGTPQSLSLREVVETVMFSLLLLLFSALPGKGIGAGDGLTFLVLGLLAGPAESVTALFLAALLCASLGIAQIASGRAETGTEYPFLPFLSAAFVGQKIFLR